jgi:uncharacterized OsmC-like protein
MADIYYHHKKTDKHVLFTVQLQWPAGRLAKIMGGRQPLYTALPGTPATTANCWTPGQLLLAAVCSSYANTLQTGLCGTPLPITNFECQAIGQAALVNGAYRFTCIHVYPVIFIANKTAKSAIATLIKKTQQQCLIAHSLSAAVIYHTRIQVTHTGTKKPVS